MKPIKIGKTPASAYNPERVVSSLQISQIQLLQEVVREGIKTEGQAAEYIRALNRRVQRQFPNLQPTPAARTASRKTKTAASGSRPASGKTKKTASRSRAASGARRKRSTK